MALVGLGPDVPLQDDWTYAWSVRHLLETGRFEVLQWSLHFPLVQVVWAAPFAAVAGFSFVSLRVSTLALAWAATLLLYLTLRELGVARRESLLGALAFALNPIVFVLSFTFMTDVPFYAVTLLAVFAFVRGYVRGQAAWLWVGAAASVLAFLTRQIGIVTPVLGLPVVLAAWPDRRRMVRSAVPLLAAWVLIGASSFALTRWVGPTSYMLAKIQNLESLLLVPMGQYFNHNLFCLLQASVALLPLTAGLLWRSRIGWRVLAAATLGSAALLLLRFGELPLALAAGESWSLIELGSSLELLPGGQPRDPAGIAGIVVRALGPVAMGAVIAVAIAAMRGGRVPPIVAGIALLLVAHVAELNALWLYVDRYVMVTLPLGIALVLWSTRTTRLPLVPVVVVLFVWGSVAGVGTRYAMRVNEQALTLWHEVRASGVAAWEIDAGYTINGWLLYAHPENLAPGMHPDRDVPFVTSARNATWLIAHTPLAGYDVVREHAWRNPPWPRRHRLYVLRKSDGG